MNQLFTSELAISFLKSNLYSTGTLQCIKFRYKQGKLLILDLFFSFLFEIGKFFQNDRYVYRSTCYRYDIVCYSQ